MKFLFFIGGFHPELPIYELKTLDVKILEINERLIYGESEDWERLKRLGYTHEIFEFLGEMNYEGYKLPFNPEKNINGKYAVRVKNICCKKDFETIKSNLQDLVWNNLENPKVDLDNPEIIIYFFLLEEQIYCGKLLYKFDPSEFSKREVEKRPFFYPISLHPRESRVLVNLSGIKPGEKLLDPFCGTGGILIESSLVGCETYGSDFVKEMIEGSEINLNYFNLEGEIRELDVRNLKEKWNDKIPFGAVVTDPPYGTASKVGGKNLKELYKESLKEIVKVLKNNGKCVICSPKRINMKELIPESFEIEEVFEEKVHKSLTREIFVLKKIKY